MSQWYQTNLGSKVQLFLSIPETGTCTNTRNDEKTKKTWKEREKFGVPPRIEPGGLAHPKFGWFDACTSIEKRIFFWSPSHALAPRMLIFTGICTLCMYKGLGSLETEFSLSRCKILESRKIAVHFLIRPLICTRMTVLSIFKMSIRNLRHFVPLRSVKDKDLEPILRMRSRFPILVQVRTYSLKGWSIREQLLEWFVAPCPRKCFLLHPFSSS